MVMLLTLKCLHLVVAKLIFMCYIAVTYDQCLADPPQTFYLKYADHKLYIEFTGIM